MDAPHQATGPIDIDKLSHEEYDRELVGARGSRSAWTRPQGETRATLRQFSTHTHHRFAEVLKQRADFRPFRNQLDRSPVMEFLSYESLVRCASVVHLRQRSPEEALFYVQRDLQDAHRNMALITTEQESPLWGRGTNRSEPGEEEHWILDLHNPHYDKDYQILRSLLGKGKAPRAESTEAFLYGLISEAIPFLLALDRTHIDIVEEEIRRRAWDIIGSKTRLSESDRGDLRMLFTTRLAELVGGSDIDAILEPIEREVKGELYDSSFRAQYENMTPSQIGKEIHQLGQRPPRTSDKEALLAILFRLLGERNAKTKSFTLMDEGRPVEIVEQCLGSLLKKSTLTEGDRSTLLRRLPVLEYHLAAFGGNDARYIEGDEGENDTVLALLNICKDVRNKLNLVWADRPSLAFAQFTCATRLPSMDVSMWKSCL